ncbi:MAG: hypothetical protein WEE20_11245, partial [Bacteroidota bacterium]
TDDRRQMTDGSTQMTVYRWQMRKDRMVLVALLVSVFTFVARAQEPQLRASVDSSEYKIGEWVHVRVTADASSGISSLVPAVKDSLGSFELLSVDEVPDGKAERVWNFKLIAFDSGTVFVPPIPFSYTVGGDTVQRQAVTNMVFLTIHGVAVDPQGDLKDIKPPLDAPWKFEDFLPYLIALILLALAVWAYRYYQKKKRERELAYVPPKPVIPPARVALAALRVLEDKKLWQQGKVKEYYSEATEIIRRFLEDQYRILALESTSDEIMQQLKPVPEAQSLLKQFQSFLTTADLVKFAKYAPTPDEHEAELRWAYEIVRTMAPRPEQKPEGTEETAEEAVDVR